MDRTGKPRGQQEPSSKVVGKLGRTCDTVRTEMEGIWAA